MVIWFLNSETIIFVISPFDTVWWNFKWELSSQWWCLGDRGSSSQGRSCLRAWEMCAWWEEGGGTSWTSIVRATIGHMLAPSPPATAADTHHLACPVHHLLLFESLQFLRITFVRPSQYPIKEKETTFWRFSQFSWWTRMDIPVLGRCRLPN